jgi:hypothetical protein
LFAAQLEELKRREFTSLSEIRGSMAELTARLREEGMVKLRQMMDRITTMERNHREMLVVSILPGDEESATRALMQEVKVREMKVRLMEALAKQLRSLQLRPSKAAGMVSEANVRRRSVRAAAAPRPAYMDELPDEDMHPTSATRLSVPASDHIVTAAPAYGAGDVPKCGKAQPVFQARLHTSTDPVAAAITSLGIDKEGTNSLTKRRENLSVEQKAVFKEWFVKNLRHPYPSELEKRELGLRAGTTVERVTNW